MWFQYFRPVLVGGGRGEHLFSVCGALHMCWAGVAHFSHGIRTHAFWGAAHLAVLLGFWLVVLPGRGRFTHFRLGAPDNNSYSIWDPKQSVTRTKLTIGEVC